MSTEPIYAEWTLSKSLPYTRSVWLFFIITMFFFKNGYILCKNVDPDQTPRSVAYYLVLFVNAPFYGATGINWSMHRLL